MNRKTESSSSASNRTSDSFESTALQLVDTLVQLDTPRHFRGFRSAPYFTEHDVLSALRSGRRDLESGRGIPITLVDARGRAIHGMPHSARLPTELPELLPDDSTATLKDYSDQLARDPRFREFCVMIDEGTRFSAFWAKAAAIGAALVERLGWPPRELNVDGFVGNYTNTPFGAHLDHLHNCMFLASGSRRMHLWHRDLWRARTGRDSPRRDYQSFVDCAETFDLEAGDVLFWPAHYVHVGECNGGISASVNVDFPIVSEEAPIQEDLAITALSESVAAYRKSKYSSRYRPDDGLSSAADRARKMARDLVHEDLEARIRQRKVRLESAGWFATVPPGPESEELHSDAHVEWIAGSRAAVARGSEWMDLGANGHVVVLPASSFLVKVLDRLIQGERLDVKELIAKLPLTEKCGELEVELEPDGLLGFLEQLVEAGAIRAVTNG